jgi:hypothetical protein
MRKVKKPTVQKLKKLLDKVFSDYIRQRDDYKCFTCDRVGDKSSIQNGHYVSRGFNSLRYSEVNCNAQCVGCNIFKKGNADEYAIRLVRRYGISILEGLAAEKRKIKQFNVPELLSLISTYQEKIKTL